MEVTKHIDLDHTRHGSSTEAALTTPIHRLPSDLLYCIFIICHDQKFPSFSVTASHVCSTWRASALDAPILWSRLDFVSQIVSVDMYTTYIARSRDASLAIRIDAGPFLRLKTIKTMSKIMRLIIPHSHRWKSLAIYKIEDKAFHVLFDRLRYTSAPNLETLILHNANEYSRESHWSIRPFELGTPSLQHLTMARIPWDTRKWHPQYDQLRSLTLADSGLAGQSQPLFSTAPMIYDILQQSPHLRSLRISRALGLRGIWDPTSRDLTRGPPNLISADSFDHLSLVSLELHLPSTIVDAVIDGIRMPLLESLRRGYFVTYHSLSRLSYFKPLPRLCFIQLYGGIHSSPDGSPGEYCKENIVSLPGALAAMPSLRFLELYNFHLGEGRFLVDLIDICPVLLSIDLVDCLGFTMQTVRELVSGRLASPEVKPLKSVCVKGYPRTPEVDNECKAWLKSKVNLEWTTKPARR